VTSGVTKETRRKPFRSGVFYLQQSPFAGFVDVYWTSFYSFAHYITRLEFSDLKEFAGSTVLSNIKIEIAGIECRGERLSSHLFILEVPGSNLNPEASRLDSF
jgi:hypothetical protein